MSKFTEILKMIPKGISNPQDIIDGWINDAKLENGELSDEQTELILKRRAICESCPLNSVNAKKFLKWKAKYNIETSLQLISDWYKKFLNGENVLEICREQILNYFNYKHFNYICQI